MLLFNTNSALIKLHFFCPASLCQLTLTYIRFGQTLLNITNWPAMRLRLVGLVLPIH